MHNLILARDAAKRYEGTPVGSLNQRRYDDLFKKLSPGAQVMVALGAPDEHIIP